MKHRELNFYKPRKILPRLGYFVSAIVVMAGFFVWINLDYGREVIVINESAVVLSANPEPQGTILQKIQEGIGLLKKSPPLEYNTLRKQVALAILNKNTDEIFEHRVWVSESDIRNYKQTGVVTLVPCTTCDVVQEVDMRVNWWNSFNTDYSFPDHPELVVVANKYPFPSSYLIGLPEKSVKQYTDIIYAPYSGGIQTPEIIEAGKKYLEDNIDQAFAELDRNDIKSLSDARTLVTAGISKDFISNIILIEHIDPDGFNSAADGGKELSERVLTVIGANQDSAYRYTGSPAGASGLAQFIKSTYDFMVARYPQAKLIKNYNAGMADHVNAIKAMVLFFDNHEKDIAGKITRRDIVQSLGITEEMLAATYNGGPSRVASSVNKFGLAWFNGQLRLSTAARILRQETLNYVKKFQAIRGLNLFANISN